MDILEESAPLSHYLNDTFYFSLHHKAITAWGDLIIFSSLSNNEEEEEDSKCLLNGFAYINTCNPHHDP